MYRSQDRQTLPLFSELMPFGGKLDENNRWLKREALVPWDELETMYRSYFSPLGRPAKDSRLMLGALCIKHFEGCSDEKVELSSRENPYMQYFCGLDSFATEALFDESTVCNLRKRLGKQFFEECDREVLRTLQRHKLVDGDDGVMFDATVVPSEVRDPTDTGLLNQAREGLVDQVDTIGKAVGKRFRTYKRVARKGYLDFSKKRRKGKKKIRGAIKKLTQYVRRNLKQFEEGLRLLHARGQSLSPRVLERYAVIRKLYAQQMEMYRNRVHSVKDRIVSLHQPWVRPMPRGKEGRATEFGPKAALSLVDGYLFLDRLSSSAFNEASAMESTLDCFVERFGKEPATATGDGLYGTKANRKILAQRGIRDAFKKLGRPKKEPDNQVRWKKKMQRTRNRIEGYIGHAKEHFNCKRIGYKTEAGMEIWIRMSLSMMNLDTAAKRT